MLQAAATAMKHSLDTQASDAYDLETHTRLTDKAFDWCESYAQAHRPAPVAAPAAAQQGEEDGGRR